MLTAEIDKNSEFLVRLPVMAGKIRTNVVRATYKLAVMLQAYVVENKLSGQVLNKITGHLQQSIQQRVQESPSEVTGEVYSAGDVKYAAIHEYGGTIHHPGGTAFFIGPTGQPFFVSNKFAAGGEHMSFINGHSDNFPRTKPHLIRMPERSYLRTSLAENRQKINDTYQQAAVQGVKE